MPDIYEYRRILRGLWGTDSKVQVKDNLSLSLVYTPGVGSSCMEIKDNVAASYELTNRRNSIAVICVNNEMPESVIPLVEAVAIDYKLFGDVDAYPFAVKADTPTKLASVLKNLAPTYNGFDLSLVDSRWLSELDSLLDLSATNILISKKIKSDILKIAQDTGLSTRLLEESIVPAVIRGIIDSEQYCMPEEKFLFNIMKSIARGIPGKDRDVDYSALSELSDAVCGSFGKENSFPRLADRSFLGASVNFGEDFYNNDNVSQRSLDLHRSKRGVVSTALKFNARDNRTVMSVLSAENIARVVHDIEKNIEKAYELTPKGNLAAVISDGTAVLGFGDIGPEAGMPVMEGKCVLLKALAGVDAMPICLATKEPKQIIEVVSSIAPVLGGLNLEDISAPRCFEVENGLKSILDIPVFHDDQHGTAIVVLAGILNSLKLCGKTLETAKIVISGAGAAALSVANILLDCGAKNIILSDIVGTVYAERTELMDVYKLEMAKRTNPENIRGTLSDAIKGADVFIGLSAAGVLKPEMIKLMANKPIVLALANPVPEIMPDVALQAGAFVVATGRSDFENQINNSLAFPGIFRGALDTRAREINMPMKIAAAHAIARLVPEDKLSPKYVIPNALDLRVPPAVAGAAAEAAVKTGAARVNIAPELITNRLKNYLYDGFLTAL